MSSPVSEAIRLWSSCAEPLAVADFLAAEDLLAGTRKVEPPTEPCRWEVPLTLRMMIGELANTRRKPMHARRSVSPRRGMH